MILEHLLVSGIILMLCFLFGIYLPPLFPTVGFLSLHFLAQLGLLHNLLPCTVWLAGFPSTKEALE